jgi:integrase/recombinase XerC
MVDTFLRYIEHEKRFSKHTVTSYAIDLTQFSLFIEAKFNITTPKEADYNMIRAWMISLIENAIEPRSVNRKIASLKSYYKFLLRQGAISKTPTLQIKSPKVKKRLPVFIEEANMSNLLNDLKFPETFAGMRDKMILELLYGTGMRLSELIEIKDKNLNTFDSTLKVTGKGNKERIIPIHQKLEETIKVYNKLKNDTFLSLKDEYFILTDKGTKSYPVFIQRIVKQYLTMVSTSEKKSPHVLRHTFATHLLNKGADLNAIKELMGHSSLSATQVYTHNSMEKLKNIFKQAHPKA